MRKRFLSMVMALAVVLSMIPAVLAGNVCEKITGTGEPSSSVTFTVETNKNWGKNDLEITQTKGTAELYWGDDIDAYGRYTVTYTNSNGKQKSKNFNGEKVKLDLKPDQTYTVTVTARSYDNLHWNIGLSGAGFHQWATAPVWTVSAQKNVTLCQ